MHGSALLLIETGQYRIAVPLLRQALEIAVANDLNQLIKAVCQDLSRCYQFSGDLRKALEYQERANLMDRYLLSAERLKTIDEIEIKYQSAEKEKQLVLAAHENLLNARKAVQHRWIIVALALALLTVVLFAYNLHQRRRVAQLTAEQEKNRREQEIKRLSEESRQGALVALYIGQEQERRRIANELHDGLGGLLYATRLQLSRSRDAHDQKAAQLLDDAIAENRRISQNLMPVTLARFGLTAAIQEWSAHFEQMHLLPVSLDLPDEAFRLPEHYESALFRITQELMNNIARHAGADRVAIHLLPEEQSITLIVEDDGAGFDTETTSAGFLKTVYSRTELLKGRLQVDSMPGHGTTVVVEIPLSVV